MAQYKVIQDIEAEDKLVGPLSLRQFIYAGVAAGCIYLSVIAVTKHAAFLMALFAPPALVAGFFAFPFGRDQPTEVWALAKIRFFLKPRRRIWDQSGVKELVTVTAPKRIEKVYTNGLSQNEVASRLNALANTIDSRGWAIKNVNVNLFNQPMAINADDSDRLINPSSMPQEVSGIDVTASDDMLDEQNNPVAQQFDQMINASTQAHRQQIVAQLHQQAASQQQSAATGQPPADYWFLNQPLEPPKTKGDNVVFQQSQVVLPGSNDDTVVPEPTAAEEAVAEEIIEAKQREKEQTANTHLKTIEPLGARWSRPAAPRASTSEPPVGSALQQPVTPPTEPAKIERDGNNDFLARNNDLSVATIARIANRKDEPPENEVVIPLR